MQTVVSVTLYSEYIDLASTLLRSPTRQQRELNHHLCLYHTYRRPRAPGPLASYRQGTASLPYTEYYIQDERNASNVYRLFPGVPAECRRPRLRADGFARTLSRTAPYHVAGAAPVLHQ